MSGIRHVSDRHQGHCSCAPVEALQFTPVQAGLRIGEIFTSRLEALEKVTKNSHRVLEIGSRLQVWTSATLDAFTNTLKSNVDLFDAIRFVVMLNLFFSPQKNGKYFLFDENKSSYKKMDSSFLAAHLVCKSARSLNKWHLIDLGTLAKAKIGNSSLGVFQFITDSLLVSSCVFHIIDTSERLQECTQRNIKHAKKVDQWVERPASLALIQAEDQQELARLQGIWTNKIAVKKQKIDNLYSEYRWVPVETRKEISKLENQIARLEGRLTLAENHNYKALLVDLSRANPSEKIEKLYHADEEVHQERKIHWVKIAAAISKIAVIAMAFVINAFNVVTLLPTVTLLACGFISDSFGLAKIAMEQLSLDRKERKTLFLQK